MVLSASFFKLGRPYTPRYAINMRAHHRHAPERCKKTLNIHLRSDVKLSDDLVTIEACEVSSAELVATISLSAVSSNWMKPNPPKHRRL